MTETELFIYIVAGWVGLFFASGLGGYILAKLHIRKIGGPHSVNPIVRNQRQKEPGELPEEALMTPPASEVDQKVGWEPDNYKDLSDGKYERFSDDDIDDAREHLTTHQRKRIGG